MAEKNVHNIRRHDTIASYAFKREPSMRKFFIRMSFKCDIVSSRKTFDSLG